MLNGKFFTGLPPKMIERGGGAVKNRLESHFFWPDDTRAESAPEGRLRRRNSLQGEVDRPTTTSTVQRQSSFSPGGGREEVDTKRMFHKEFAKSSIQFYDNIEEEPNQREPRAPIANNMNTIGKTRLQRQEIAPKPTATKAPPLPESSVDDEITPSWKQKQHAFTSKIEFYDYVDEDQNRTRRNNARPPRMDMNDKREVERNTKNSPKLQVKRDVRSFREHERSPVPEGLKVRNDRVRAPPIDDQWRRAPRRSQEPQEHFVEVELVGGPEEPVERRRVRDSGPPPSRRSAMRREPVVDHGMRVQGSPSMKKHVTYEDERYGMEELQLDEVNPGIRRWSHDAHYYDQPSGSPTTTTRATTRPGNDRRQPRRRPMTPDFEDGAGYGNADFGDAGEEQPESYQYMETRPRAAATTTINNNISKPNNIRNHTQSQSNKIKPNNNSNNNQYVERKITPKVTATKTTEMESYEEPSADAQKHLRSNICFNGSEVTAAAATVTAAAGATSTPTSQFRRNARSSAVQRVSVGLPD